MNDLTPGEVHGWRVSLDVRPAAAAALYETLAPAERARSARLRFERDRWRFVVARGALRSVLGRYLGVDPREVHFVYGAFGKPAVNPEFGSRLKFNLSHSGDLAFIALALDADLGVDIEYIDDSEYRTEAFLKGWTEKEARAKAGGQGLAMRPASGVWSVYPLRLGPRYVGTLAIARSGWRTRQRQWRS